MPTILVLTFMRTIHTHETNPVNQTIEIRVMDEPGHGGANHVYQIVQSKPNSEGEFCKILGLIKFQNGPIKESGINGLTHEALLAIVADRLESFQAGPYACHENRMALGFVRDALAWLKERTNARESRGVEGTSSK